MKLYYFLGFTSLAAIVTALPTVKGGYEYTKERDAIPTDPPYEYTKVREELTSVSLYVLAKRQP